jgi:predicted nucleic acid-binding protein
MLVVSNTSPVLNLAIIGQLALLREQFGEIWIPPLRESGEGKT